MKRSTLMMAFFGTIIMVGIFECLFYGNFQPGNRLCINELMAKGSSLIVSENSGQNEWIELYNGTSNTIQLKNYGLSVSASKEGVVHNRSFFVILTTDSFEALFISYFKPAGIW